MRNAALCCVIFAMSCSNTPAIPSPTGGGDSGTGGATASGGGSAGGSSATGGGTTAAGGGTSATGGANGGGSNPNDAGLVDSGTPQMANDAGTCMSACDCNAGDSCMMGHCNHGNFSVYCCGASDCPNQSVCQRENGQYGQCGGGMGMRDGGFMLPFDAGSSLDGGQCGTSCDCPAGQACFQGGCLQNAPVQLYCCEDPNCPPQGFCQSDTGMYGRCGGMGPMRDGGMMMPPGLDGGAFDYCPFIMCTDPSLCAMAGCTTCGAAGTCEK